MRLPLVASYAPLVFQSLLQPPEAPPQVSLSPRHAHSHALDKAAPLFLNDGNLHTWGSDSLTLRTRKITIKRPKQRPPHILSWAHAARARRAGGNVTTTGWDSDQDWDEVEVEAPDVTDRQTLLTLAKMSSNSYIEPNETGWFPLPGYNGTTPYGWEPNADGLRGHIVSQPRWIAVGHADCSSPTIRILQWLSRSRGRVRACSGREGRRQRMTSTMII